MSSKSAQETILSKVLKTIIEKEGIKEHVITKEEIPCTGINYTATIYLITIKYKDNGKLELFAKVAKSNEIERKALPINAMYRRETFIYLELMKLYNDLQEKYKVPFESRFHFAKFYAYHSTAMEETIILENLKVRGFHTPDRFEPIDWEFGSMAVSQLAKFHALSYVFELENSKLFDLLIKPQEEYIYTKSTPHSIVKTKYIQQRIDAAMACLPVENAKKLKAFLEKHELSSIHQEQYKPDSHPCLVHGDYKHTNLMVKYQDGKLMDLVPVDYQFIYYGSPITDLLYFIFTGSDEKFREQYYDELIDHYYMSLAENLEKLSYKVEAVYPRADFNKDVKGKTIYGLIIGILILPYMLAVEKPNFSMKLDEMVIDTGIPFEDRFNGVVNDFIKWGYL